MKWKDLLETEATWKKDTTLWKLEKEVEEYLGSILTRASTSYGGNGLLES